MDERYLFRGKAKRIPKTEKARKRNGIDGQGFVYGAYSDKCRTGSELMRAIYAYSEYAGCCNWVEILPKTVGQCTGLKDKNGKLIFEGDILQDGQEKGKVKWLQGGWWVDCVIGGDDIGEFPMCDLERFEIIGNIYDNPELLTEGHK